MHEEEVLNSRYDRTTVMYRLKRNPVHMKGLWTLKPDQERNTKVPTTTSPREQICFLKRSGGSHAKHIIDRLKCRKETN